MTERLETDLHAFPDVVERGEWDRALALYGGRSLESARLVDTKPFEEWADRRDARLASLFREEGARQSKGLKDPSGYRRNVREGCGEEQELEVGLGSRIAGLLIFSMFGAVALAGCSEAEEGLPQISGA